jgi:hypothetical protein
VLRVDRQRLVLMSQVGVAHGGLLLLTRLMSDALDFLELVLTELRGLLVLIVKVTLELLSRGLADSGLLLRDGLNAGKMLAKLKLALLCGLLALLICGKLLILGLLQQLLIFMVDSALALESETASLLSHARGNWSHTIAQDVQALDLSALELFLDVTLGDRGRLRICFKAFLDLRGLTW